MKKNNIGNFNYFYVFIIFIFALLVEQIYIYKILTSFINDLYLCSKIAMLISHLLLLFIYLFICKNDKLPLCDRNYHQISLLFLSQLILLSIADAVLHTGLCGVQVYLIANISMESASKLWEFKQSDVVLGLKDSLGLHSGPVKISIFLLLQCILAPIVEELYFRGLILNKLLAKYSAVTSLIISSALFTFLHNYNQYLGCFVGGIIFGLIYLRYRNLFACIVVHGASNLALWLGSGLGLTDFIKNKNILELADFSSWSMEFLVVCLSGGGIMCMLYFVRPIPLRSIK